MGKRIRACLRMTSALLVCILLFVFAPSALADEVRINITATPTELTDSGVATFSFEIANYNADYPMLDLRIHYMGQEYDAMEGKEIPPGGSAHDIVLKDLPVSESQLDKPISFLFTWTRNGEPMQQEAFVTIHRADDPVIQVMRTADVSMSAPGGEIVLTYTIKNDTKFDMTDVTLIDENVSDKPILKHDMLEASGTFSINHRYTMGEESVVSTPFVTYTVNGKTKTFSALEPLELTMVRIELTMKIDPGVPTIDGVNFTFNVKNSGTQTIRNITIKDERGGVVNAAPFSLNANESTTLSYLVVPLMTEPIRNVSFALAGTDAFDAPYTLSSEQSYEVYPYVDASQINVSVRAETVTPWTSEAGLVTARVIITNHSTVELTNVSVSETTIGVVKMFETLAAGETSFDQEIVLGAPRNLQFTVKGYDPTGLSRELASCMLPVAYAAAATTEASEPTPTPNTGGNMNFINAIGNGVTKLLIVLGVLMVLSFVILLALGAMERSKTSRLRLDDGDDDDEPDALFTPPSEGFSSQDFADERIMDEHAYRGAPNEEEISYTKRMLAIEPRGEAPKKQIAAPPVEPTPALRPTREPAPSVVVEYDDEASEPTTRFAPARSLEEALPQTREKPVSPPVSERTKPEPETIAWARAEISAPKVFEYRAVPAPRPLKRSVVTRVNGGQKK